MRRWVAVAVVLGLASPAVADEPPALDVALQRAVAADQPLVLEFSTEWCGACKLFEAKLLPDARVQRALADVTFVRYDAEKAPGDAVASRYNVNAYPTFLVIDRGGVERARLLGAPTVEAFVALVAAAPAKVEDEATLVARVKAHPADAAVQLAAGHWYVDHALPQDAIAHYDVVATQRTATPEQRAEAAGASARLRRHMRWRQELVAEKLAAVRADPLHATADDLAIATIDSGLGPRDAAALFARVLAAQTDPARVNNLVYSAIAAGANAEALAAAKKMIESLNDAQHLDTLAETYYVTGNQAEALRVEDQALALAKTPSLVENRARFAAGTGKAREVIALEARTADLWKQLDAFDQLPPPRPVPPAQQPSMQAYQQQFRATMTLGNAVSTACNALAGTAEEALARVTLDAKGHVTSSVLLLEPGASDAFRACLTRELAAATLPVALPKVRVAMHFRHVP